MYSWRGAHLLPPFKHLFLWPMIPRSKSPRSFTLHMLQGVQTTPSQRNSKSVRTPASGEPLNHHVSWRFSNPNSHDVWCDALHLPMLSDIYRTIHNAFSVSGKKKQVHRISPAKEGWKQCSPKWWWISWQSPSGSSKSCHVCLRSKVTWNP